MELKKTLITVGLISFISIFITLMKILSNRLNNKSNIENEYTTVDPQIDNSPIPQSYYKSFLDEHV